MYSISWKLKCILFILNLFILLAFLIHFFLKKMCLSLFDKSLISTFHMIFLILYHKIKGYSYMFNHNTQKKNRYVSIYVIFFLFFERQSV